MPEALLELRLNPVDLGRHLLGGIGDGPGLLRRVEQRVLEQDTIDGPTYRTGSVIPTGAGHGKDSGSDSGLSETCTELLITLTQWLGRGISEESYDQGAKALVRYLVANRITDVYALTQGGRIKEVRERVKALATERATEKDTSSLLSLVNYLQDWMESDCDHQWVEEPSDGPKVYRCACGVRRREWKGDAWLPV